MFWRKSMSAVMPGQPVKSLTRLTWVKASARSFWLIPQRLATLVWHLWWTFKPHSEQRQVVVLHIKTKNFYTLQMQCIVFITFTLESLLDHSPQQTPTVVAEGWAHVVMCLKAMRHVNLKALFLKLQMHKMTQVVLVGMKAISKLHYSCTFNTKSCLQGRYNNWFKKNYIFVIKPVWLSFRP